jgi:acyl-CoA synthetase (NDP forming)
MSHFESLDPLFHPRSIALAGITTANPEHWTRVFFDVLIEIGFEGPIYLVNPKGGEIQGCKVYKRLRDIPGTVDYVISTVPAQASPGLVEECGTKGVRAIHFCTAGFSETGEKEGARLEAHLVEAARRKGMRIIGPNCMGIYCPQARLSFGVGFPREGGQVAFVSQSGGNAGSIVRQAAWRGVRFSKVISYGNACDLNESDFLEYLTDDPDTKIIALYIEGVKDGARFHRALERAAKEKVVVLLKGGITHGGTRAAAGHTGSLAGDEVIWDALCRQFGIIRVYSLQELADMLQTLLFLSAPKGRNVALIGAGGGNSVLIADEFEKKGFILPQLPQEIIHRLREFSPAAGNILRNPIDYSQTIMEPGKVGDLVSIVSGWESIDLLIGFLDLSGFASPQSTAPGAMSRWADGMFEMIPASSKPIAMVLQLSVVPEDANELMLIAQRFVSSQVPTYMSFAGAATSINLSLTYKESYPGRLKA